MEEPGHVRGRTARAPVSQKRLANRVTGQAGQVGILVVAAVIELLGRIEPNGPLGACTTTGFVNKPGWPKLNKLIWLVEINSKELF